MDGSGFAAVNRLRRLCQVHLTTAAAKNHSLAGAALRSCPRAVRVGFSIWERRGGNGRNVTFPARQYAVNGERRSFALLRPIADVAAQESVREAIDKLLRTHPAATLH